MSAATQTETKPTSAATPNFVYFADPMCSWCYGFAPVITELADRFEGRIGFRIVMGGLRAGNTQAMRPQDREYISGAWQRVAQASGQPFDHAFFDREHFVYDTEPACRAVVIARQTSDRAALALMSAISSAFYAYNRDVTNVDVLADVAAENGFERDQFLGLLQSSDARNATMQDFMFAKQSNVEGFPCLLVGEQEKGYALVTHGFRPLDGLPEALESWLASSAEA